jgi:hypothetical protein
MPDKPNLSIAEQDARADRATLELLLYDDSPRPWSDEEIGREIGGGAPDCIARLHAAGLLHRLGGFAWPTRAAIIAHTLND